MTEVRLLLGCPGGGKTRALTEEAEAAAEAYGNQAVAICSLTRTAAKEIAGRVEIPDDAVGTLHAHCYRALGKPGLAETPEGLRSWNEAHPEAKLTGGHGGLDDLDPESIDDEGRTHADQLHAQVMVRRARMEPPETWTDDERDHAQRWERFKDETDRLDFTDLIERALATVDCHPSYPQALLGDEAQDFSRLELALFRKWARQAERAVLAADPDQVLYQWRGALPDAFDRIPERDVRVLGQSYRVPRAVHRAATRWISQIEGRRPVRYEPRPDDGRVTTLDAALAWPEPIVSALEAEHAAGRETMLLATCGYMLTPALQELRKAGIPFHNPHRPERSAWNPLRPGRRLAAFLRPSEACWAERSRLWTWGDLKAWTEPLSARDALARGAKALIESKCREDRFGISQQGEEAPTETVAELLGDETGRLEHPAFRLDADWWETSLLASHRQRMAYPLQVLRRSGPRALVETPRISTGTVHSVKGGESSAVYLAPDLSRTAMWDGWVQGGALRDQIVRCLYVGLTRAREEVVVLSASGPEQAPVGDALSALGEEAIAA